MQFRIRLLKTGLVLHSGYGAVTGQYLPVHSGSSPTTYRHGIQPPPDELQPHGSPPPAAADWPPDEKLKKHLGREVAKFSVFL